MNSAIRAPLMALMLFSAGPLVAAKEPTGFTVNPGIGYTNFAGPRNLDGDVHGSIGVGYRFDSPFAIELNYTGLTGTTTPGGVDVDANMFRVDGLYHLRQHGNFVPFLSFGLGELDLDQPGAASGLMANAGLGLKYLFSDRSAIRADLKSFRDMDNKLNDAGFTLSYQHQFGQKVSAPRPAPIVDGDDDRDGVRNSIDVCPNTAPGVSVDARGCADDTDGDGVKNAADKCPNSPRGQAVGADGCPVVVAVMDSDKDGVPDSMDKCPASPAGAKVDSTGCELKKDKVVSSKYACTETNPQALVDEKGCFVILEKEVRMTMDVEFDFDSAATRPAHIAEVRKVAEFMAEYPRTNVVFEGHSDSKGADAYNQRLSERRAATVANILVDQLKIDRSRVSSIGYGEARPIATNETAAGRQSNRRVVASIVAIDEVKQRL